MGPFETLTLDHLQPGVAVATSNWPDRLNALNFQMLDGPHALGARFAVPVTA